MCNHSKCVRTLRKIEGRVKARPTDYESIRQAPFKAGINCSYQKYCTLGPAQARNWAAFIHSARGSPSKCRFIVRHLDLSRVGRILVIRASHRNRFIQIERELYSLSSPPLRNILKIPFFCFWFAVVCDGIGRKAASAFFVIISS